MRDPYAPPKWVQHSRQRKARRANRRHREHILIAASKLAPRIMAGLFPLDRAWIALGAEATRQATLEGKSVRVLP